MSGGRSARKRCCYERREISRKTVLEITVQWLPEGGGVGKNIGGQIYGDGK